MNLDHEFRGVGKEARYALSDGVKEELLRRLLELNFEIAASEQSAVSDQPKGKKKQVAKGKAKKSDQQMGLL